MDVPQDVIDLRDLFIGDQFYGEGGWYSSKFNSPKSPWLALIHGDSRLDNFYFDDTVWESDDNLPGIIDLQLCAVSNIAQDVVYCLSTQSVYHRWPEEVDRLLHRYFDKLQSLGAARGKTFAEFEEQLALAAAYRMMVSVIGTGGGRS
eukprot:SAG31_NODE_3319_length_4419_cov_1.955556_2_plen_148_part_00